MKINKPKEKNEHKFQKNRIFKLHDQNAPRLSPALAAEIGLNESILFLQIEFWIAISDNVQDDRRWTYQSITDIKKVFSFWSVTTINRAIQSLEKKGLIIVDNHNRYKYDRTRWIAINFEAAAKLTSLSIISDEERLNQDGTTSVKKEGSGKNQKLESLAATIREKLLVINPVIPDDTLERNALRQLAEHVEARTITMNDVMYTAETLNRGEEYMVTVQPTSILKRVGQESGMFESIKDYQPPLHSELYNEVDDEEDDEYEDEIGFINPEFDKSGASYDDVETPF